jgi:hypothetical protein
MRHLEADFLAIWTGWKPATFDQPDFKLRWGVR